MQNTYQIPISSDELDVAYMNLGYGKVSKALLKHSDPSAIKLDTAKAVAIVPVIMDLLQFIRDISFKDGKTGKFRFWDFKRNWKILKGFFSFAVRIVIVLK